MQAEIEKLRQDTARLVSPSQIQRGHGNKQRPSHLPLPDDVGFETFEALGSEHGRMKSKSPIVKDAAAKSAARRLNSPTGGASLLTGRTAWGDEPSKESKTNDEEEAVDPNNPQSALLAAIKNRGKKNNKNDNNKKKKKKKKKTSADLTKYEKMRTMGIPDGAIRHKMKQDGVESQDIATFFSGGGGGGTSGATAATPPVTATLNSSLDALKQREDMAKYFKMKKLGLPDGPIRQKMMKDGLPDIDVAAFFGEAPPSSLAATSDSNPALRETLAKYYKMKKLGLPDGAIRQKMMKDNVDETSMAIFFGEATVRREAPDNVPKIDMSMLRAQQTARREEMKDEGKSGLMSKYFKMQSMGIPMGAIRQKMKNDAVTVQDIAAFCGDLPSGPPPKGGPSNAQMKSNKARSKLKQLHWKKLDSVRAKNSMWGSIDASTDSPQRNKLEEDMAQHFGKKKSTKNGKGGGKKNGKGSGGSGSSNLNSKGPQRILDPKRARNIEIGLAQFRAFSKFEDLGIVVCSLDQSRLSTDRLETLVELSPTKFELKEIMNATARMSDEQKLNLGAAEKFHLAMSKIPRFREKVQCFLFKSGWDDHGDRLDEQIVSLSGAIDDILHCKGLSKVLETVLSVGNLMNKGTHAGDAVGITLDSLLKLTSTKSHDNKMTVLDYVVQTMLSHEKKRPFTKFPNELTRLRDALKCSPNVLKSQMRVLETGVNLMKKEAKEDENIVTEESSEGEETTFSRGILKFLKKVAQEKMTKYQKDLIECDRKCAKLREHFGEDDNCDVVALFDVLDKFSTSFATSVQKTTDREARKRRMSEASTRGRGDRRRSRSPEQRGGEGKEGKEGSKESKEGGGLSPDKKSRGRRGSRSPGRRGRGSSVEGKRGGGGGGGGETGGPNLLAAIMAKGGIGGLKKGIELAKTASPGTKQRHQCEESLTAMLLQMGHDREEVPSMTKRMMKGKSVESVERMVDEGEKSINNRLDELNIPKIMSASEKRVAMLNAMMAGRK